MFSSTNTENLTQSIYTGSFTPSANEPTYTTVTIICGHWGDPVEQEESIEKPKPCYTKTQLQDCRSRFEELQRTKCRQARSKPSSYASSVKYKVVYIDRRRRIF
jgi:hypothetical protein